MPGLSGPLRPGNAGANTAADHITVLDQALTQLWRYGAAPCGRSRTSCPAPPAKLCLSEKRRCYGRPSR